MTDLTLDVSAAGTSVVLTMAGDLDYHTAPQARQALQDLALEPGQQLVLDLTDLAFCDSSGIAAFVAARNRAVSCDAGIALVAVPERIVRIFKMVGLDRVFVRHGTVAEAVAAWPHPR